MRQYVKSFEELNESFFKRAKSFFGGGDDVKDDDENEIENEPDMEAEYRDIVERLKMSFDEPRAIHHYVEKLKSMGKWEDFITSKDGEDLKRMIAAFKKKRVN